MSFVGEKCPAMTVSGKQEEHWIADVSKVSEVLKIGVELQSSSGDVIGTHFKVNSNGQLPIGSERCVDCIQTRSETQQCRQSFVHLAVLHKFNSHACMAACQTVSEHSFTLKNFFLNN